MEKIQKYLMLTLVVTFSFLSSASINSSGRMFSGMPRFIPQSFSLNDKTILYVESDDTEFAILDEEFNEISRFSTPSYPEVTAEYSLSGAIDGPINVFVTSTNNSEWWIGEDTSKESLAESCAQQGFTILENHGSETWYLSDDSYYYYYYDIYGKIYPEKLYVWNNNSNQGFERQINYDYESWGPTGLYGEPNIIKDYATPEPLDICIMDSNCNEKEYFRISQTLFNSDADFEWIVPIIEAVDISYTNEYEKCEGKRLKCTGFRVESQSGSVIATVKFPNGLYGFYNDNTYLYIMNKKIYLFWDLTNKDNEYYYMAYELDASNASVNAVSAPRRIKVSPTMPQRGTDVNITFENSADSNCKIIITSVSGKIVLTQNVQPGTTSAVINTERFEKGLYIVSVSNDGKTQENTKIIVR